MINNVKMYIKKGDVYLANLPVFQGSSIQSGVRPIIVGSNKMACKHSPVIQYIPITSKMSKNNLPTHVVLESDFFEKQSMALAEQLGCIDKNRLIKKIGTLTNEDLQKINRASRIQQEL